MSRVVVVFICLVGFLQGCNSNADTNEVAPKHHEQGVRKVETGDTNEIKVYKAALVYIQVVTYFWLFTMLTSTIVGYIRSKKKFILFFMIAIIFLGATVIIKSHFFEVIVIKANDFEQMALMALDKGLNLAGILAMFSHYGACICAIIGSILLIKSVNQRELKIS